MNEREFLDRRSERIRARMGRRCATVNGEIERAVTPLVRAHPRKSLAAGAVAGLAVGAALRPAASATRRAGAGVAGFLRNGVGYALRIKLIGALVKPGLEVPGDPGGDG